MGSVVNFADILSQSIQAGSAVEGTAVRVIADNGAEVGDAVFKVIEGGNGVAQEVGIATQAGASGSVATGLAFLATDVGVVGAAIAPALGILAGVGLYNLAPEFWTNISDALVDAGKTIGGKVITYWNGENFYVDEDTIEIFKTAFINAGIYENEYEYPDITSQFVINFNNQNHTINVNEYNACKKTYGPCIGGSALGVRGEYIYNNIAYPFNINRILTGSYSEGSTLILYNTFDLTNYLPPGVTDDFIPTSFTIWGDNGSSILSSAGAKVFKTTSGSEIKFLVTISSAINPNSPNYDYVKTLLNSSEETINYITIGKAAYFKSLAININTQEGATYPTSDPFPQTYPDWYPLSYPQTLPDPSELPTVYPLKYPQVEPDPYPTQDPAQNPDPESVPDIYPNILPDFTLPDPGTTPEPTPEPDPDPQPEPEPITPDPDPSTSPDPIDPNPDPTPSPIVTPVNLPDTVSSNKLFTVYNPTSGQLDSLGGYLWDASLIAAIRDIWQDPLDGIISLIQVYATPTTSGSHNIILGYLDSGISAAVVSAQFVTIDCGSVTINENKLNATDYAPYTSLHLYLPFIGIVELDTAECMNATITVTYKVDVYTGTCLAEVSITRTLDMPNDPILYTYSGNCSQQLPLTSGNATGVLSALIGGITAGLSVASGGGLGVLAGAQIAGNSLTHEMFHVTHSGNISANAGIMGQKKPYIIIGRRHCYDANNYSSFYGFPANKTVNLGNHNGFIKVKKCWLKSSATNKEYDMILSLLREGVIL